VPLLAGVTLTVVLCEAEPPAPVQAKVYLVAVVSFAVLCEPIVACVPLQPPEAVHEVALVDDQLSIDAAPLVTVLGAAARVTDGAGVVTETVADCAALPPAPLHVSVYVAPVLSAPVDDEPLVALLPDQAPEAVHEVALVAVQLTVELAPLATVLGFAVTVTAGAEAAAVTETVTVCVALPPAPLQVSV
jgi:hypothetical protein